MREDLKMCCGTTCDARGNMKYVQGLLTKIVQLEEEVRGLKTENERLKAVQGSSSGGTGMDVSGVQDAAVYAGCGPRS